MNYAVEKASIRLVDGNSAVLLSLVIDMEVSAVMDYFEIFMERMLLCRKAAEKLGLTFSLVINDQIIL